MRILDAFCCQGGAGAGYVRSGFSVTGVDIEPQPRNPHTVIQADAIAFIREHGHEFDAIHASPPCQAYTTLRHRTKESYVDLVAVVREALEVTGRPWVIENVVGAPLCNPIMLCGTSFGLGVDGRELRRHRLFESNVALMSMPCAHTLPVVGVYGTGGGGQMTRGYKATPEQAAKALDIDWMNRYGLSQAIPPAYTEFIGGQLMQHLLGIAA